jgi:murein L,D-transpeptidase YafK
VDVALYLVLIISMFTSLQAVSSVDLVKVDKSKRMMYLLDGDDVVKQYTISLGADPKGHKEREGDEKTPQGRYILDYKKEDSSFYRAMHITYPNSADVKHAQEKGFSPGGFIMVHGQRNGFGSLAFITQNFDWTNGCIAITNDEMDEFMSLVDIGTKIQIDW